MPGRPKLTIRFFRTNSGAEPVRDWLNELSSADSKVIGDEIRVLQFAWPIGMPLVRKLEPGLWGIRVHLVDRIARVLFTIFGPEAVLIHGFIKKDRKTPLADLSLGRKRMRQVQKSEWRK